jgi:NDP-4-keto-2,6-dideoxyhexose 3-C-methyltransferase
MEKLEHCRNCKSTKLEDVLNIGTFFPSGFISDPAIEIEKLSYALVQCKYCNLVQMKYTNDLDSMYKTQYWYKSSLNNSMLRDLQNVVENIESTVKLKDGELVVDIGANDGSLFTFYSNPNLIKVGFDPAPNLKETAETRCRFINDYFPSKEYEFTQKAKVITSIAMFYDLPDPNKFINKIKDALAEDGIWVIQYTGLYDMLKLNEFTNITPEHLEYYSLRVINSMLFNHNLTIFRVEYNKTNGASTRLYICHKGEREIEDSFYISFGKELEYLNSPEGSFISFIERVDIECAKFLSFLWDAKPKNELVVGLGASTKANTFLQYCNITNDLIPFIGEVNPDKFGLVTLGSYIPIVSEDVIFDGYPDYIVIFIWQFTENILNKPRIKSYIENGGKVVVYLPEFKVYQ